MTKVKKPANMYIDKVKLLEEFKKYKEVYNKDPDKARINNYIGKCIQDIAENLATLPKFNGYSFIDEMKADGIENVLMYIHNFDPEKSDNPFAYITTIIYYAFIRRIAKEKKQHYIKYKMVANYGIFNFMGNDNEKLGDPEIFNNLAEYIEEFEEKKKTKDALKVKKPKKIKENLFTDIENDPLERAKGNDHKNAQLYDILLPNNDMVLVSTGEINDFCQIHNINWSSLRRHNKYGDYTIINVKNLELSINV